MSSRNDEQPVAVKESHISSEERESLPISTHSSSSPLCFDDNDSGVLSQSSEGTYLFTNFRKQDGKNVRAGLLYVAESPLETYEISIFL